MNLDPVPTDRSDCAKLDRPSVLPLLLLAGPKLREGWWKRGLGKGGHFFSLFLVLTPLLLTGCVFKAATVPIRHYVLSPISTNETIPVATNHLSVGIGFVKMPSYLLKNSMAVRNGASEIEYLDDAQWAERLDQCFQNTLAANLSRLLASDRIYFADWSRDQVQARLFIQVQQFDVDTHGHGTLIAHWRITAPDSDVPLKSGQSRLDRTGASPHGDPHAIATTLSNLAAEFSRVLAQSLRESVKSPP